MNDLIVIGGGIAGLYLSYLYKQYYPNSKLLLIERNKTLGGRAGKSLFYNTEVVTGAGIGRLKKDLILQQLMGELNMPIKTFMTGHHYAYNIKMTTKEAIKIWNKLRKQYLKYPVIATFKDFATFVLGTQKYKEFITFAGFTDYEKEDVYDTLFHYGFEDNLCDFEGFRVDWSLLVDKLATFLGKKNILLEQEVINIAKNKDIFCVELENGKLISTKKVVISTTISSVNKLVTKYNTFYKQIKGQPFLRVYGKFAKHCREIIKEYVPTTTIVKGPLQKILPMNSDKGIYMISYSDNKSAIELSKHIENTMENRSYFCNLLEKALGISKNTLELVGIQGIYWEIGTHYYKPTEENREEFIYKLQRPLKGMFVVGEMISLDQGWVEGALQSVDNVINEVL